MYYVPMGLVHMQAHIFIAFVSPSKELYLLFQCFMCETLREFLYGCSKSLCGVYVHCMRIPEDSTKSSARVRTKLVDNNVLLNESKYNNNHIYIYASLHALCFVPYTVFRFLYYSRA